MGSILTKCQSNNASAALNPGGFVKLSIPRSVRTIAEGVAMKPMYALFITDIKYFTHTETSIDFEFA